jgi:esterase/lipase superfamily enzyme/outer membrane protein OmpA-like peptidoglycan-associated protein
MLLWSALALSGPMIAGCASNVLHHPRFGADCDSIAPADTVDCVTVLYGTNRRPVPLESPNAPGERDERDITGGQPHDTDALTLGRADIWLPRLSGANEPRPAGHLDYATDELDPGDPNQQYFVYVTRITVSGRVQFLSDLRTEVDERAKGDAPRSILLFVHGFNTLFEPALIRAAQLSIDLRYQSDDRSFDPGAPIVFAWPSRGGLLAYTTDRGAAGNSIEELHEFLNILTNDTGIERVNIVVHSMGNRVLTRALEAYAQERAARTSAPIEFRIIMAAADLETEIFEEVAPAFEQLEPDPRVSIYSSNNDVAMFGSHLVALVQGRDAEQRLGYTNGNRPVIADDPDYTSIDATNVAMNIGDYGHGYYANNVSILNDVRCALADVEPGQRALDSATWGGEPNGDTYWIARQNADASDDQCYLMRQENPASIEPPLQYPPPPPPRSAPPPPPPPPPPPAACPTSEVVVYFEWDRSNLNPTALETIDAAVARARQCNIADAMIVGHTDASGAVQYNQALSERRASVVRDALVGRGVPNAVIRTEARGETDLARATRDGVREPLNRRTSVTIRFW